jgi:predicted metal-dependent phosphoesterase TrpH
MRIDLHMHSVFSDGLKTPTELVTMAKNNGLAAISLTDHDSLGGIPELMQAGKDMDLEVISGCELSCEFAGRDLHVLGYGVDHENNEFQDALLKFRDTRHDRGVKIIEKLNALGIDIKLEDVLAKADGAALGRPHIANVLVEKGLVGNVNEAFDKYIAEGGPAYVPKYKMSPSDATTYIHNAGGLAFTAHPGIFMENRSEMLELLEFGFDGIEVFHPKHNPARRQELKSIADERGLLVSGGTDYHGFAGRDLPMGSEEVSYELLAAIKERLGRS